ncbi:hypothetical protein ACFS2C_03855 [Prauserella oleivorans]|uniref:Secreted protein n=1 Tax=Prauserella oleivorans TaxID=1478153 RepID=A0ABW5W3L5_9PSEU
MGGLLIVSGLRAQLVGRALGGVLLGVELPHQLLGQGQLCLRVGQRGVRLLEGGPGPVDDVLLGGEVVLVLDLLLGIPVRGLLGLFLSGRACPGEGPWRRSG